MRFTGQAAATPASMILSWITDNRLGRPMGYDDDLVRRAKRDPGRLPPLVPTGSVLGSVLPAVAKELGLGHQALERRRERQEQQGVEQALVGAEGKERVGEHGAEHLVVVGKVEILEFITVAEL